MKRAHLLLALCPLLAAFPAATSPASAPLEPTAPELRLKKQDHESLGKLLASCIAAISDKKLDRREEEEKFKEALDKLKKRKVKDADPLSLTEDLQAALWYAAEYSKQRGIKKGKVETVELETPLKYTIEYAVWTPSKYNAKQGPYPLLMLLPDVPQPGQGVNLSDLITNEWQLGDVRDAAVLVAVPMPDDLAQRREIGSREQPGGIGNLLSVFAEVTRRYAVDFDRIFLVGHGAGVETAVAIASRYPDRFAGVVGRSGDAGDTPPLNFSNLPTLFTGAGQQATAFAEKNKELGYDNCTILPEADEAAIWSWISSKQRVAHPRRVVLYPGSPFPVKAYWVQVPPQDGSVATRVEAVADRESNSVTVQAKGVRQVTLFFNDILLDLDRPVKVSVNGVEHEDRIPRNFNTMMELIYGGRSDPGKLYTAFRVYDVPEAEEASD